MIRWLAGLFAAAWALALGLFLIGHFGLFGSPSGPLDGIFLVPLGLPWTLLLDGLPDALLPWLGALAPGLNLALLLWLGRRQTRGDRA